MLCARAPGAASERGKTVFGLSGLSGFRGFIRVFKVFRCVLKGFRVFRVFRGLGFRARGLGV